MSGHFDYCSTFVKRHAYERYLSVLYAPTIARPSLFALYAFAGEIGRIRDLVNDPMPGEIRLQWWYDTLNGVEHGEVSNNPVAQALLQTIDHHKLPLQPFLDLIEARRFDLYSDPMPTLNDLEGYCGETSSAVIQMAALILSGQTNGKALADPCGHGGVAYALAGLLQTLAWQAARQQTFMPKDVLERHNAEETEFKEKQASEKVWAVFDEMVMHCEHHLEKCEAELSGLGADLMPAFLPVFQVQLFLHDAEKDSYEPLQVHGGSSPLRRMWHMWRSSRHLVKKLNA